MRTSHLTVGLVCLLAAVSGVASLIADPGPIARSAAAMIALGLAIGALVSLSGIVLARAPWGLVSATLVVVAAMAAAAVGESALIWPTVALGATALVGLHGPWLALWLRKGKLVEAPGPVPIALTSIGAVAYFVVGVCAWQGASLSHWIAATSATLAAVLFGRGNRIGLWSLRTVVPALVMWAAFATTIPGAVVLALAGVTTAIAAWLPAARRTTTVITPPLPEPVWRS